MTDQEIISSFVKPILEKYADPIIKGIKGFAKDEWEKFKVDFDIVFKKYLNNATEKYSKIKTILYKTEPKYIYDFFECPYLKKGQETAFKGEDINRILDESNFIIVQGTGGIGKSTFLKHLFLNEVSHKELIPVFIELKDINTLSNDYEITDFIFQKLYVLGSTIDKKYMEYALKSGCFLFLLDGYDEILSEKMDGFFSKLESFCDQYSGNYYILSSRPYSDFVEFQRFTVLTLCSLSKKQAKSLISKIDYDTDVKNRFIQALEDNLYDRHRSFASNPLLLNIMLLTFDNYAEIPSKLHLFYSNAFDTLYFKHDATKAGYHRELKCKLSADAFKKVFSYFCFMTYYQGKIEFTYDEIASVFKKIKKSTEQFNTDDYLYDLVNSICVLYKEGLNYKFTHRSFQEYFTAIFLKELSDSDMQNMTIKLIKKDTYRVVNDSALSMLRDMAQQRFEQNVLIPLLKEVEFTCSDDNKYDFYFKARAPILSFHSLSEKSGYRLFLRTNRNKDLTGYLFDVARDYTDFGDNQRKEHDLATQKLLNLLTTERNIKTDCHFSGLDFMEDDEVYSLLKSTWFGAVIHTLSNLSLDLEKKREDLELDLTGLLVD